DINRNLDLAFYGKGSYGVSVAGAPLLTCDLALETCRTAMGVGGVTPSGSLDNNGWAMVPQNTAGGAVISESTTVSIPDGATVIAAFVEWAANTASGDGFAGATD